MDDETLIQNCQRGDREAQRELYDRTVNSVYRLLLRMTRNTEDAFDLAQETYIRAFEHIGQFRGGASIETWLYRIAANEALQFLRRRKTELSALGGLQVALASGRSNPEPLATRVDVTDALGRIEPNERLILLLRYVQGLDYRSIASVLECAEGTVASRLNRARARLRQLLSEGYGEREGIQSCTHPTEGTS